MAFLSIQFTAYKKYKYSCSHRYNSSRLSHITPTLESLHWLPIFYRINFKMCCVTHRALFLCELFYLSTLLTYRSNTHSLRSTSFSSLLLPYFNEKSNGFRTFSYAASFLWNLIPNSVRYICANLRII